MEDRSNAGLPRRGSSEDPPIQSVGARLVQSQILPRFRVSKTISKRTQKYRVMRRRRVARVEVGGASQGRITVPGDGIGLRDRSIPRVRLGRQVPGEISVLPARLSPRTSLRVPISSQSIPSPILAAGLDSEDESGGSSVGLSLDQRDSSTPAAGLEAASDSDPDPASDSDSDRRPRRRL